MARYGPAKGMKTLWRVVMEISDLELRLQRTVISAASPKLAKRQPAAYLRNLRDPPDGAEK